jgi:hypothetical protein
MERIANELRPVTNVYKEKFVAEGKFNEYFHLAILMQNEMPKGGANQYSSWMRLANEKSAGMISRSMATLFNNVKCGHFKEDTMAVFNVYFEKAQRFPTALDESEWGVARNGLAPFVVKRTDTNA